MLFSDVYTCCGLNSGSNLDVYSVLHIIQTSEASVAIQSQIPNFLLPGLLGNGNSSRNEKLFPKIFRGQTLVSDSHGMVWNICLEVHDILHQPSIAAQKLRLKGRFMKQVNSILSHTIMSSLGLTWRTELGSADWIHAAHGSRTGPACHVHAFKAQFVDLYVHYVRINMTKFSNKYRDEASQLTAKMVLRVSALFLGGPLSLKRFPLCLLQREQ